MQLINNLSDRLTAYQEHIQAAINRVLSSGRLILGPECKRFEQNFAEYLGVKECIGTANGTEALELALKALGITSGDTVATVANAGMYTTAAILSIGAKPFFIDVSPETYNTCLTEVQRAVSAGVKGVVITHLYGLAVSEMQQIAAFCAEKNVSLLEDCAQAHGAQITGQRVGSFGDVACFSFYPTKNLGALGDGGAIVTNTLLIAEKARLLTQYGWTTKYKVEVAGGRNSRLDEIQAAILSEFLPYLDKANARRRKIAQYYNAAIQHPKVKLPMHGEENYVAHLYVIQTNYRGSLQEHLRNKYIVSDVHYPIPDHQQPVFNNSFSATHLEHTEQLSRKILSLPCYPEMTDEAVQNVVHAVNSWSL